jgi:hypothetical protein
MAAFWKLGPEQGFQMVYFQTKNPNLGKFWKALDWKMLIYFIAIGNILRIFGIFYDHYVHLVHFSGFGITNQDKSGNTGPGIGK